MASPQSEFERRFKEALAEQAAAAQQAQQAVARDPGEEFEERVQEALAVLRQGRFPNHYPFVDKPELCPACVAGRRLRGVSEEAPVREPQTNELGDMLYLILQELREIKQVLSAKQTSPNPVPDWMRPLKSGNPSGGDFYEPSPPAQQPTIVPPPNLPDYDTGIAPGWKCAACENFVPWGSLHACSKGNRPPGNGIINQSGTFKSAGTMFPPVINEDTDG